MNIFDHSHNETYRMIDGEILFAPVSQHDIFI